MFEIIPSNIRLPFMKYRIWMVMFSLIVTALALFFIVTKGFNYGIDFAGGVQLVLRLPVEKQTDAEQVRQAAERMGLESPSVQAYGTQFQGNQSEYMVHFAASFLDEAKVKVDLEQSLKSLRPPEVQSLIQNFRFVGLEKAYLTLSATTDLEALKKSLRAFDFGLLQLVDVSPFGRATANEYQLNFSGVSEVMTAQLKKELNYAEADKIEVLQVEFVGAKVGADLRMAALISLLLATALIFVYIFIRFDLIYAPGVVLALLHDVIVVSGVFALLGIEFDLTIVAALLTLAGYSINDTIVIYDRIREVSGSMRGKKMSDIIDVAISQTLGRTVVTGGATFLATLALWFYGGPVLHGFALAFLIGIVIGTYSSIFVASPMILWVQKVVGSNEARIGKKAA